MRTISRSSILVLLLFFAVTISAATFPPEFRSHLGSSQAVQDHRQVFALTELRKHRGVYLQAHTHFTDRTSLSRVAVEDLELDYQEVTPGVWRTCVTVSPSLWDRLLSYVPWVGESPECFVLALPDDWNWRIAYWVAAGGHAAFTYVSDDVPDADAMRRSLRASNMAPVGTEGEFVATALNYGPILDMLMYVDYSPHFVEEESNQELVDRANQILASSEVSIEDAYDGTYINTDVDAEFITTLTDGRVEMSGVPARYYWLSDRRSRYPWIEKVHNAQTARELGDNITTEFGPQVRSTTEFRQLVLMQQRALNFYQTAALFRTFAHSNSGAWIAYIEKVGDLHPY